MDDQRGAALTALRAVMKRVFDVEPASVTEATRLADIERWDSLNMILFGIGIERRLGRPVDVALFADAASVGDLLDALCQSTAARP
jgi:acyl carrier protein